MPLAILKFPSIKEFVDFLDNIDTPLTDSDINYGKLTIIAAFSDVEMEMAKSKYSATLLTN